MNTEMFSIACRTGIVMLALYLAYKSADMQAFIRDIYHDYVTHQDVIEE